MASIGHVIVGLAAARAHDVAAGRNARPLRLRIVAAVAFAQLALLPDMDVIGFRFGIRYEDAFGHRGASHSIVAALVLAAVVSVPFARALHASILSTFLATLVSVGSHSLLDMLTDGGLGVAVFWPFDELRYFLPVQPIPVSPIGRAFLSARGLHCALTEVIILAPLLLYAVAGHHVHRLMSIRRDRQ